MRKSHYLNEISLCITNIDNHTSHTRKISLNLSRCFVSEISFNIVFSPSLLFFSSKQLFWYFSQRYDRFVSAEIRQI